MSVRPLQDQGAERSIIPLFNPAFEADACAAQLEDAYMRVARTGIYVNGSEAERFEGALAEFCGIAHAVAVSSGTAAINLLLKADGIGLGDRVATSAHTFVAVVEAILDTGAEPYLVDIDPDTWQMPLAEWDCAAAVVSHLYGGIASAVAARESVVYEDVSQSFGASLGTRRLGTLGKAGAISFYPTKNLSALGDAGAVIMQDAELARRIRALRNHGQTTAQEHVWRGTTARIDELQAAFLNVKLRRFPEFLERRRVAERFYVEHLSELPLRFPVQSLGANPAPNLFVIRTSARDVLRRHLQDRQITTGIHYPTPIHRMPAYQALNWADVQLPHTERLCSEIVSLPLWVGITFAQQRRVIDAIHEFFGSTCQ
jgi:dTDP-4-amino-4,6-dideoxygalactose transaminase